MTRVLRVLGLVLLWGIGVAASADSGGPYAFVPDLRADEFPPTVAIDGSFERPLDYFLSHRPLPRAEAGEAEPSRLDWEALPADVLADLVRVGRLGPRRVYAVRLVPREPLALGSDPASAILIVSDVPGTGSRRFRPVFFTTGGVTRDHTASGVLRAGDQAFMLVRRHYDGQGNHVDRIALYWDRESRRLVRGDLAGGGEYWRGLRDAGWQPRSRGHGFDEQRLQWIHSVFRGSGSDRRLGVVRVPVLWRDGRFRTGDPVFDDPGAP